MSAFNYSHLKANGAVTLAPAPVLLHSVTVNTKGAAANTLTLQDGASGPTIAIIDTTANVGFLLFDVQCQVGLVATLATGTAADITVAFG